VVSLSSKLNTIFLNLKARLGMAIYALSAIGASSAATSVFAAVFFKAC